MRCDEMTTQQKTTAMLLTSCLSWDEVKLPSENHCSVTHSLLVNVMKNCLAEIWKSLNCHSQPVGYEIGGIEIAWLKIIPVSLTC